MSALRKIHQWQCTPTGYVRPDRSENFGKEMLLTSEEPNSLVGPRWLREYEWRIQFGCSFSCTDAELELARENAARMLLREIYGPIALPARKALSAIFSQDFMAARAALEEILDLVEGKQ